MSQLLIPEKHGSVIVLAEDGIRLAADSTVFPPGSAAWRKELRKRRLSLTALPHLRLEASARTAS